MHHLSEPIYDEDYVFHEWLPSTKPTADPLVIVVTSKYKWTIFIKYDYKFFSLLYYIRQMMQLRKSRKKYRIEWSTGLDTIIQTQAMHFVIEDQNDEDPGLLLVYKVCCVNILLYSWLVLLNFRKKGYFVKKSEQLY